MAAWTQTLLQHPLAEAARREPRKAAVLAVLMLVAVVVGLRTLGGGGPAVVQATTGPGRTLEVPQSVTVATPSSGGRTSRAVRAWLDEPLPELERNLFSLNLAYFRADGLSDDATQRGLGNGAKSADPHADASKQREILISNIRREAGALRLQTIMLGARPTAVLNEQLVGPGSVVNGFKVVAIEQRQVIVEREGILLEVKMR